MEMLMHSADLHCRQKNLPVKLLQSWSCWWSTSVNLQSHIRRNLKLALILQYLRSWWPNRCSPNLQSYESRIDELSLLDFCVVWDTQVVIPPQGRAALLLELHMGHPGMARMKSLVKMYVWWPGIDNEIETSVSICQDCQQSPIAPLHPCKGPTRPWTQLHIDFAGLMNRKVYPVVIGAHSNWIEYICHNLFYFHYSDHDLASCFCSFWIARNDRRWQWPMFCEWRVWSFL